MLEQLPYESNSDDDELEGYLGPGDDPVINPRRACARVTVLVNPRRACARVTVLVLSVCVFPILAPRAIRRTNSSISDFSAIRA